MYKMTKEQSAKFDLLFKTAVNWGDLYEFGTCQGLFKEFGSNLSQLSTGVVGKMMVVYYTDAETCVESPITDFIINATGKSKLKKIVCHLVTDGFDTLKIK